MPRSYPRQEQLIRAQRAVRLGLVSMLDPAGERDPRQMAETLRNLPQQSKPSSRQIPGLLSGHQSIAEIVRDRLETPEPEIISA